MHNPEGSVTLLLARLRAGDRATAEDAAARLWQRYFAALARLARTRLPDGTRRAIDEEDVALSAFDSFCRGAAWGRFPALGDRDGLWRLLATITLHKVRDAIEHTGRQKRDAGRVREAAASELDELFGREPAPEMVAQVSDLWERLLACLGDEGLRRLARLKLDGHTDEEIAALLGIAERTVRRKVHLIRCIWEREVG
jgi:DNA-directed RNA polymerase specialized sigma24 family protein